MLAEYMRAYVTAFFAPLKDLVILLTNEVAYLMILVGFLCYAGNQRKLGRALIKWALVAILLVHLFPLFTMLLEGFGDTVQAAIEQAREAQELLQK